MLKVRVLGANKQNKIEVSRELRVLMKKCCLETLYAEGYKGRYEISVTFVDDEQIREINNDYRGIDNATDVLSFPLTGDDGEFTYDRGNKITLLGDIVISLERAANQADEYGHSFRRELAFLTVHSMLHLLGYDHVTSEEDEKIMFAKQEMILDAMGIVR